MKEMKNHHNFLKGYMVRTAGIMMAMFLTGSNCGLNFSTVYAADAVNDGVGIAWLENDNGAFSEETESETETEAETAAEVSSDVVELGERPTYDALAYVTLGQYKGLEVPAEPVAAVTDEDIDEAVNAAIKDAGKLDVLQAGIVQDGDIANIDYEGKKDGVAFDGGSAEGYDLEIGSGTFIDGFEEGLVGKRIGSTVNLDLTFPEDYGNSELAGQAVVFTVTINSVQRMPEVSDDLIRDLTDGEYTTVEAYRKYQKEQLEQANEENHENEIKTALMEKLYDTCTVNDYPEDLVTYVVNSNNNYYAQYANAYDYSLNDFISRYFGLDRETYDEQTETSVKQSLRQELILEAIAQQEGLTEISEEDYQSECERYAEGLDYDSVEDFQAAYSRTLIEQSIAMDRAMDFVYDNAVITEEEETEADGKEEEIIAETDIDSYSGEAADTEDFSEEETEQNALTAQTEEDDADTSVIQVNGETEAFSQPTILERITECERMIGIDNSDKELADRISRLEQMLGIDARGQILVDRLAQIELQLGISR